MDTMFFLRPVSLPGPFPPADGLTPRARGLRSGMLLFYRRAAELLRAAPIIDGSGEPGLVLPVDRELARRRARAAAWRFPRGETPGEGEVLYLRTFTGVGLVRGP